MVETKQPKEASKLLSYGKYLVASATGLSVLIYAIGFLCHVGHHKMLGISHIEHPNDQIVFDGVAFFVLTPVCIVVSFCVSWLPWLISLLLVSLSSFPRIFLSLFPKKARAHGILVSVLKKITTAVIVLLYVIFFFLSGVVASQGDQLVRTEDPEFLTGPAGELFTALSSRDPQLSQLLKSSDSWSVYGLLFFLATICTWWLVRNIQRSLSHKKPPHDVSKAKVVLRRILLGIGFYFLLLVVLLSFCLYGYLVKSNKFPVIELQESESSPFRAEPLYVLGECGSRTLLYSREEGEARIWWVESSACLPVSRSKPPENVLKSKELAKDGDGP